MLCIFFYSNRKRWASRLQVHKIPLIWIFKRFLSFWVELSEALAEFQPPFSFSAQRIHLGSQQPTQPYMATVCWISYLGLLLIGQNHVWSSFWYLMYLPSPPVCDTYRADAMSFSLSLSKKSNWVDPCGSLVETSCQSPPPKPKCHGDRILESWGDGTVCSLHSRLQAKKQLLRWQGLLTRGQAA